LQELSRHKRQPVRFMEGRSVNTPVPFQDLFSTGEARIWRALDQGAPEPVIPLALAKRRLGWKELKLFSDWNDGRPKTELNFKFYRQATNKIAGISDEAAAFLRGFF
jgi:hypothetical protein